MASTNYETAEMKRLRKELPGYLKEIKNRKSHSSKMFFFAKFLENVFGIGVEDFSKDLEKFVKSNVLLVSGRIDAVFGNLVIEFKVSLPRELDDAEIELKKYLQALREKRPTSTYVGVATDGVRFYVFKPILDSEGDVDEIKQMDYLDLEKERTVQKAYLWFDSYFFTSQPIVPVAEDLKRRFGADSPTFAFVADELMQELDYLKKERSVQLKFEKWAKYLEIVYGDQLASKELFVRHTYLSMLAKLIVYLRIYEGRIPEREEIFEILEGESFRRFGIQNFVDEDFFAWILQERVRHRVTNMILKLLTQLLVYDLSGLDEDVFKELYQELVDPEVRHDLGEYYTPDWLANYIVKDHLVKNPKASVFDPACGSGTFLFTAIREISDVLKEQGDESSEVLSHILKNVVGVDIHPLAVIISRTNYLLALRELLEHRKGPMMIPVYLADSIRLPSAKADMRQNIPVYEIEAEKNLTFSIPQRVARQPWILDEITQKMFELGKLFEANEQSQEEVLHTFERAITDNWALKPEETQIALDNMKCLVRLISAKSNSIWTFILRNIYKPISLAQRKFDIVTGNPPWLAMRYMKDPDYQEFLKKTSKEYGLVDEKNTHLFTHMEMATLFFRRTTDLFLRDDGIIAFVMPRSILVGSQHRSFLDFEHPSLHLQKIIDLEEVAPLFNVPACVLIAKKGKSEKTSYPVEREILVGELERKNATLDEAIPSLSISKDKYTPPLLSIEATIGKTKSYYYDAFYQGATIIPRTLWFVKIVRHKTLGIDPSKPYVETADNLVSKKPWDTVQNAGKVESDFLYATLLSTDIVPFGHTGARLVVLPLLVRKNKVLLFNDYREALNQGFTGFANFMANAEREWAAKATAKSRKLTMAQRLNYRNLLTRQRPFLKYRVLYVSSATNMAACVVEREKDTTITIDGNRFKLGGFFAESTSYRYETDSKSEAHYLCAILNSNFVNSAIKPIQARGLFGERHVHKRPLLLPFPKFNSSNPKHKQLAQLAEICARSAEEKMSEMSRYKSIGKIRSGVRSAMESELAEIDGLVLEVVQERKPNVSLHTFS